MTTTARETLDPEITTFQEETVERLGTHRRDFGGMVRREKPRVSAFASANAEKILALKPDLQADIAAADRRGRPGPVGSLSRSRYG